MGILRRTFALLVVAGILSNAVDAFAKGPRTLLNATLSAVAGGPANAVGKAKFDKSASRTNFSVEGQRLAALNGQVASVFVNGALVGSTPIALNRLKLEISTQTGATVPTVAAGTTVDVMVGSQRILSGKF